MRTKVYFVRLIEEQARNVGLLDLKIQSMEDANFVTKYLSDKEITAIYSSPYTRAYDTLSKISEIKEVPIFMVDDLREHFIGEVEGFEGKKGFFRAQWGDFDLKTVNGESLRETQRRCVGAVKNAVSDNRGKDIVIGTHGVALATIVNYYYPNFSYEDCMRNMEKMPFIVAFRFDSLKCEAIDAIDLFMV